MNREEAKKMFRDDKDSYGKPKAIISKIDKIYDEFEAVTTLLNRIKYEYAIIPVSYKYRDYNEYVNSLNDLGEDGWIVGQRIWTYENSPLEGYTTHDFICHRKKC